MSQITEWYSLTEEEEEEIKEVHEKWCRCRVNKKHRTSENNPEGLIQILPEATSTKTWGHSRNTTYDNYLLQE